MSKAIAFEVAAQAQQEGMALRTDGIKLRQAIERSSWTPEYRSYRRRSF